MKILKFLLCALFLLSLLILPVSASDGETGATASGAAMQFLKAHTGDLFCILTFLGSLLTARAYRAGLLPQLSRGIGRLDSDLKKGLTEVTDNAAKTEERLNGFVEECKPTFTKLEELESALRELTEQRGQLQQTLSDNLLERERLFAAVEGQNELLYGILMAANLPAYQKDALGEAYLRAKTLLSSAGAEK